MIFEGSSVLAEIGDAAFAETGLTKIPIPAFVAVIGEGTFAGTESIESVTFEARPGLRQIGENAFG
jgi:hypothetical protein